MEISSLVVHILVPSFATAHESKHYKCIRDTDVVLVVILPRAPLRKAEDLHKHDSKEHKQNKPQSHQTEDDGKTRTILKVNQPVEQHKSRLCAHCCLEQLVQTIRSLYELEGDCNDEQFLQRGEDSFV